MNWKKSRQGLSSRSLDIYTFLDLSNKQLSGKIPASLGALEALKLLNISYNKLSGKIPESFGDIKNLESLDLSHNQLSGSIPQTLTKLQQLTILDVNNNQLTGRIRLAAKWTQRWIQITMPTTVGCVVCKFMCHVLKISQQHQSRRSMITRSHGFCGKVGRLGTQLASC